MTTGRRLYRPQPRRHVPIASGVQDYRRVEICERCGSTWDASVHHMPERTDEERAHEQRRIGER